MAYSIDYRKKAIEYWEKGCSKDELYDVFGIYPARIYEWKNHKEKTGSLKAQYPKTRKRKIDLEKLEQAVERKPDAYLSELAKEFDCTESAIFYALKRLKITVKKNSTHTPKNHG
jgi:transposase